MLQFTDFKPQVFCDEEVLGLEKNNDEFILTTTKRITHTRQIIVAIAVPFPHDRWQLIMTLS